MELLEWKEVEEEWEDVEDRNEEMEEDAVDEREEEVDRELPEDWEDAELLEWKEVEEEWEDVEDRNEEMEEDAVDEREEVEDVEEAEEREEDATPQEPISFPPVGLLQMPLQQSAPVVQLFPIPERQELVEDLEGAEEVELGAEQGVIEAALLLPTTHHVTFGLPMGVI